jgi:dTDP-4-dehydrorhamnose 3,5-epimerase-like enzyme
MLDLEVGKEKRTFSMDDATKGIYIPRMIFTNMYDFSEDAVCLVLANTHYDINKSIRNWDDFLKEVEKRRKNN